MKYFIVLLGFLILQSCVKEDNLETPEESKVDLGYKYSKKVDVFDTEGNSAVVQISSNDFQDVNSITDEDLEFRVSRKDFSKMSNTEIEEVVLNEKESKVTKDFSEYIFVDVIETDLLEDITGYFVQVKNQTDIATRGAPKQKFYSYGSTGARGARVEFVSEERSSCKLKVDLDKLESTSSIWYSNMAQGTYDNPGIFNHREDFEYYKYRLTIDIDGWRCGEFDLYWIGMWIL